VLTSEALPPHTTKVICVPPRASSGLASVIHLEEGSGLYMCGNPEWQWIQTQQEEIFSGLLNLKHNFKFLFLQYSVQYDISK
jgi:hypothetical protein